MIICVYSYMYGYIYPFSNIELNLNKIDLGAAMASFLLLPFCILSLILSLIKNFEFLKENEALESLNTFTIIFLIVIGFIGCKFLFIIPTIFFLLSIYITYNEVEFDEIDEQQITD